MTDEGIPLEKMREQLDAKCGIKMPIHINHVQFDFLAGIIIATAQTVMINIGWLIVYWLEHPLVNRYKALKQEPWPWHVDPNFKTLVWKAIGMYFFNSIVTTSIIKAGIIIYLFDSKALSTFDPA